MSDSSKSPLENLFEHAKTQAREIFLDQGNCMPVFITLDPTMIIPFVFGDNNEKRILADAIRAIFKQEKVSGYVYVFEAWMAMEKRGDRKTIDTDKLVPPSQRPDRTEAIVIMAENKNGETMNGIYPIIGKKQLGPFEKSDHMEAIGSVRNMLGMDVLN